MRNSILTAEQIKALRECEVIIERGRKTFVEVGRALLQIKQEKLYLRDFESFTDYCRERWGFDRNYAKRLIRSAEVVCNLQTVPIGTLPVNETQARPLAQLPVEQQANAWQDALNECKERGEPITAAAVVEVVAKYKAQADPYREQDPDDEAGDDHGQDQHQSQEPEADADELWRPVYPHRSKKGLFNSDSLKELLYRTYMEWSAISYHVKISPRILPKDPAKIADLKRESRNVRTYVLKVLNALDKSLAELDGEHTAWGTDDDLQATATATNTAQNAPTFVEAAASAITAAPTAAMVIIVGSKTYEVQQAHGLWEFRRSPEAGWTACSEAMAAMIEQEGTAGE